MMKNYMTMGTFARSKKPDGDSPGKAATPFIKEKAAMSIYGTPATHKCHTPVLRNGTEASIRVPRMFKSHARQQYDKQMKCYK
jgi:hypothetical protein